jgi:hypothetical protein
MNITLFIHAPHYNVHFNGNMCDIDKHWMVQIS